MLRAVNEDEQRASAELLALTTRHPLHRALAPTEGGVHPSIESRRAAWRRLDSLLASPRHARARRVFDVLSPFDVWSLCFPLAEEFVSSAESVFGLAGPPGAGKSTLAAAVVACMEALRQDSNPVALSLDDFYYPRERREALGFRWRGAPGTHDVSYAQTIVDRIRSGDPVLALPRYDHAADRPAPPRVFERPISAVVLEGWFVGNRELPVYEELHRSVGYLVYLDMPMELAKERRYLRERRLRASGDGRGLSEEQMEAFWNDVLHPGVERWVLPVRDHAHLQIRFDRGGDVLEATARAQRM